MIRTSKHIFRFVNLNKKLNVSLFLLEYEKALNIFIDYLWNNEIIYKVKEENRIFNISKKQYECPLNLTKEIYDKFPFESKLSARALKCCSGQACSMVRAVLDKPKRYQYVLNKLISEGKDTTKIEGLISNLNITKPVLKNVKAELCSICCNFKITEKYFDGFLELFSIGKEFSKIRIPIKFHRQSNKWMKRGKMMKSFLISENLVEIRWENKNIEKIKDGEIVGADQGLKDVITLSNGNTSPKKDCYGHTLKSITKKLSRKKKGSKAFAKAQEHRKNFINWSINSLNLNGIRQINFEKIVNIRFFLEINSLK